MKLFVLALGFAVAMAQPGLSETYLKFCQRGNATLHIAEINGFNGLFAKTKGAEGWFQLKGGECYREMLENYQTKEYVYAARTSDGQIVPVALDMGFGRGAHRLLRNQLCVPAGISGFGRHHFRTGAEVSPCSDGEISFPASFLIEGGSADQEFGIDLDVDQRQVDALAPASQPEAAAPKTMSDFDRAILEMLLKPAPPAADLPPARTAEDLARGLPRDMTTSGTGDIAD